MKYFLALLPFLCFASDNKYIQMNTQRIVFLDSTLLGVCYKAAETKHTPQSAITSENNNARNLNKPREKKSKKQCCIS
jgi:hypothetical protein